MASPDQQNKPKYMCLQGKTQYEMAKAIDEAAAQAEQAFGQDTQQVALQIWYEQFEQQVLDELNIYQDNLPDARVDSEANFIKACEQLWHFTLSYHSQNGPDVSRVQGLFQQSFMDAMDMLKARDLWRFDLQRKLQHLQTQIRQACQ